MSIIKNTVCKIIGVFRVITSSDFVLMTICGNSFGMVGHCDLAARIVMVKGMMKTGALSEAINAAREIEDDPF